MRSHKRKIYSEQEPLTSRAKLFVLKILKAQDKVGNKLAYDSSKKE